jgi:hypothetical protein
MNSTIAISKTTIQYYVIGARCYLTEGYRFVNNFYMRTYPAPCSQHAERADHIIQTITLTAWADKIARDYMLVYLGHGNDFAEAVWVRREDTMRLYSNENFSIPIFNYE